MNDEHDNAADDRAMLRRYAGQPGCTRSGHQPGQHDASCVPPADPGNRELRLLRAIYGLCPDCDRAYEHNHDVEIGRDRPAGAVARDLYRAAAAAQDGRRVSWLTVAGERIAAIVPLPYPPEPEEYDHSQAKEDARNAWQQEDEDDPEPEEYDPGPEVDDEGGMSEYRSSYLDY